MSSNGTPALIADGYTMDGYIAAVPRLYPAMRFKYRPILIANRSVIFREMGKVGVDDPQKSEHIAARACKAQLVEWDLTSGGKAVPLTVDSIMRLQPSLNLRLFGIVMGQIASDEDPDAQKDDSEAERRLEMALAGGKSENLESLEAADAKN